MKTFCEGILAGAVMLGPALLAVLYRSNGIVPDDVISCAAELIALCIDFKNSLGK